MSLEQTLSEPDTDYIIIEGSGDYDSNFTSVAELPPVTCRENFVLINSTCHPICHLWEQDSHVVSVTRWAIGIMANTVGLIVGIFAIVISLIDYKRM